MAYVNVAEWTAVHVGDWLRGLDDSILPYVQFFVNNQINGCRLLLLTPHDLLGLNILKVGHQEIILEAVELLKQLHYSFTSETLQTISLKLACRSRSLYNQLRHSAAAQAAKAALDAAAAAAAAAAEKEHHKDHHHKEKHRKDKHHKDKKDKHAEPPVVPAKPDQPGTPIDQSPVSTGTLTSVAEILAAVKDFMSWIDRYPFDGQEKYIEARKNILKLAIELASTSQRDQFVQGPNEVIRERCKELAEICDRLVQELSDSLAMQSATLEVVTVTKNIKEELGMHIHSSYSGIHQVGGLKFDSPAALNGQIEEGDEIVQVNYQTVVGWQLKKLVASMRQFPTKIILTVKKRPRHYPVANFTLIAPYALPIPEMTVLGTGHGGSRSHQAVLHNADQYYGIPQPVVPVPESSFLCASSGIPPLPIANPTQLLPQPDASSEIIYSTGPQNPIPVSTVISSNYGTYNPSAQQQQLIYESCASAQSVPPTGVIPQTLSQYNAAKNSPSKSDNLKSKAQQLSQQHQQPQVNTAVKSLAVEPPQKSHQKYGKKPHIHRSKNGTERKSRVATTRCSSASDSSPFSMSDSTSTMYSSSDDEQDGNSQKRQLDASGGTGGASGGKATHLESRPRKPTGLKNVMAAKRMAINNPKCECTTEDDSEADYIDNDDNDSAFYSGRTTSVNDVNGSGSGNSSGGSASGRCSSGKMPPSLLPPKVVHTLAQLKLSSGGEHGTAAHGAASSPSPPIVVNPSELVTNRTGRPAPIQPRTSAEFEALYLQKTTTGSQESMMTAIAAPVANKVARASTLPPNTQPCTVLEHEQSQSKPEQVQATMCNSTSLKNILPHAKKVAMTTIVNSLTNLAQNIRTANTVAVNSVGAVASNPGQSHSSAAKIDLVLSNNIQVALSTLTLGDTEMGNHEDTLFIYRGGADGNTSPQRAERLPHLGPMVLDRAALECSKWTKIHAVLKENCLHTNPIAPSTNGGNSSSVRFELPVHLPGYYILVNKSDILTPLSGLKPSGTSILLYVFKLVTYHHLYLFAVDTPNKLAQWIVKFGYKFCCNPSESQLCFTYYLSTAHVEPISKTHQALQKRIAPRSAASSIASHYAPSGTDSPVSNGQVEPMARQPSACSTNPAASLTTESELESDDYNDLTMGGDHRVKVKFTEPMNGIPESTGNAANGTTDDLEEEEDCGNAISDAARRYTKSPHPRGSARFAVRPLANNQDFIDSIVDPKKSLECAISAALEEDEHIFVEIETPVKPSNSTASKPKEQSPSQTPPELPPRTSLSATTSAPASTLSEAPRPKPRISKMASTTSATCASPLDNGSNRSTLPTKEITTTSAGAQSKVQSLVSNRQHLAPIPVPEKSAAISQTIQHFANLQRQNNLRRSSQQLNSSGASTYTQSSASGKNTKPTAVDQAASNKQSNQSYSDYDYIGVQRPMAAFAKAPQTPPPVASSKPLPPTQQVSPGVGNPLYCSVPPPLNQRPQPAIPLDVPANGMADREYNRMYGASKPNLACSDDSPSSECSSSEPTSDCSPPPPKGSPPPLPPQNSANAAPPVIRDCVLKTSPTSPARPDLEMMMDTDQLPDDNNNNIDEAVAPDHIGNSSFNSSKISSPKMIKRNKPKHAGVCGSDAADSGMEPENASPPTLLPRRSNVKQKTPPPLPTTSHPSLSKANSTNTASSHSQAPYADNPRSPIIKQNGASSPAVLSAKSLNRSLSDAYTRTPSGRVKPRKSLESGLMCTPEQMAAAAQMRANEENGLPSMPNTPTSRSIFFEQLLAPKGLTGPNGEPLAGSTSDLSCGNRSAPTMGVSMLGKKRLSNVSADCFSIEKALNAHNDKQGHEILRKPSITSFDGHLPTSHLARASSMNAHQRPSEEHQTQWDQIEHTLVETKQRLLKHGSP